MENVPRRTVGASAQSTLPSYVAANGRAGSGAGGPFADEAFEQSLDAMLGFDSGASLAEFERLLDPGSGEGGGRARGAPLTDERRAGVAACRDILLNLRCMFGPERVAELRWHGALASFSNAARRFRAAAECRASEQAALANRSVGDDGPSLRSDAASRLKACADALADAAKAEQAAIPRWERDSMRSVGAGGRPTLGVLAQVEWTLRSVGFSFGEIADLVCDEARREANARAEEASAASARGKDTPAMKRARKMAQVERIKKRVATYAKERAASSGASPEEHDAILALARAAVDSVPSARRAVRK